MGREITVENCYDEFVNVFDSSMLPFWMETDVLYLFSTTKTSRNYFGLKNIPYAEAIAMENFEDVIIKQTSKFSLVMVGQEMSMGMVFDHATKAFNFFEVATKARDSRQIFMNGLAQGVDIDLKVFENEENKIVFDQEIIEQLLSERIAELQGATKQGTRNDKDLQAIIHLLDQLLMGFHQWPSDVKKEERQYVAGYLAGRFLDLVAKKFQDSESNKVILIRKLL